MKVHIKKRYYKNVRRGKEPIRYTAKQPRGIRTDIYATVRLDPILKRHPDLRKGLLKHELEEIKLWGKGSTRSHTKAKSKEPKSIKNIGGVSGFWNEIKRRNSKNKSKPGR